MHDGKAKMQCMTWCRETFCLNDSLTGDATHICLGHSWHCRSPWLPPYPKQRLHAPISHLSSPISRLRLWHPRLPSFQTPGFLDSWTPDSCLPSPLETQLVVVVCVEMTAKRGGDWLQGKVEIESQWHWKLTTKRGGWPSGGIHFDLCRNNGRSQW